MITDGKNWHYLSVKSLLALLRGITSKERRLLPFKLFKLFSFRPHRKKELKKHEKEKVCNDHDYCYVEMPNEDKILKYNFGEKSLKVPAIIYADLECLLEKML